MRRLCLIVLLVSLMASVASASWYWTGSVNNSWANTNNWHDTTTSPPGTIPHSNTESMRIPQGTVTADDEELMGYLMMGRTDTGQLAVGNATVNLNSGVTVNVYNPGSSELVSVAYTDGFTNNLNVSNGRLVVWRGNGGGELRLNHIYSATCVGNLNLSGTGFVDTEILNRGERAGGGTFTGTGGKLVIRDEIDKFDLVSNGKGFNLGGSTLEINSWADRSAAGVVGKIEVGNSQDTDFTMTDNSAVVFDLGDPAGEAGVDWDHILTEGDWVINGTLKVEWAHGYVPTPGDKWEVWDTDSGDAATYTGSGSFDTLPINIQANLINSGDTLELTYVPEPATMLLFGLGGLLIRRKK